MTEEEKKIKNKFLHKTWNEVKTNDSWAIFKIMSEFVEGFEKMSRIGPCVSIFGSARTKPQDPYYILAEDIAYNLTQNGYGVITGGGPGIMEAGNKGAMEGEGVSVGLNIDLPHEQNSNLFVDPDKNIDFDYFFVRKVMFVKYAQAFVVLPGGFGTLDELFESITLIQTDKIGKFPIVLVGRDFWSGLLKWVESTLYEDFNTISKEDFSLFKMADTSDEVVEIINDFYKTYTLKPNF